MPDFISVAEAMELTGKSQSTISRLIRQHKGSMHVRKDGKAYAISKAWLLGMYSPEQSFIQSSSHSQTKKTQDQPEKSKPEEKAVPLTSHNYLHEYISSFEKEVSILEVQLQIRDQQLKAKEEEVKAERQRNDRQLQSHNQQIREFLERIKEQNYTIAGMQKQLQAHKEPEQKAMAKQEPLTPKRDPLLYYVIGAGLLLFVLVVIVLFMGD